MLKIYARKREIRVCVIGAGRAGQIHAGNFARHVPGATLAAIAEPDERAARGAFEALGLGGAFGMGNANGMSDANGKVKWHKSHTEALGDKSIDAYIIVTPSKYHRDIFVDIASCGKHALCEKPMAMTAPECDDMIAAAEKHGVILQIGFMRRFDESYVRAKAIVDSGAIGDVVMVRSNTRGPSVPQPWMYDLAVSNGPLAEVNSHDLDTLRWFTGSEYDTIFAVGGNFRSPEAKTGYPDFYDNVVLAARMKNGAQGLIDGAQGVGYAYDARAEILGTKGCVFIGQTQETAVVTCTADDGDARYPLVKSWRQLFHEAYLAEDSAFCEAVRNGAAPPRVTGHDGKMAVAAVDAGNRSIRENRAIYL
jgi:myo-inositol 2-dehydrogenase/D-chiro-inositol 1-dehydrogenase/scyllo-inositol 2-dehydrogenase (NAD+)